MQPLESTHSAANTLGRVRYSHDAMIDIIIAKPSVSGIMLAKHFGYSQGWVSRILCSDAFQARLAERRSEIVDPTLVATFEERLKTMALQSMEIISEKLEKRDGITGLGDVTTAFKALELGTKCLGYGARQTNVAIQNNFTVRNAAKASDADLEAIAQGVPN